MGAAPSFRLRAATGRAAARQNPPVRAGGGDSGKKVKNLLLFQKK
jgi:hypothetical protein